MNLLSKIFARDGLCFQYNEDPTELAIKMELWPKLGLGY